MTICNPPSYVYMPPIFRSICCLSSGQFAAFHKLYLCCPPFRPCATRNYDYMPPSIMSICCLPSCLYAAFHHVYMPPSIMSIKYYCSSAIKHRLNTAFQALGEGGQHFLWRVPSLPRPQQQQPGCYCRRRKGIPCKVWRKYFRLAWSLASGHVRPKAHVKQEQCCSS